MKTTAKGFILGAIGCVCMLPPICSAQSPVPVVFVHGLMSDSSTWNSTTSYVGTNLYATTYAWTIDWRTTFENQRDTLKSRLAANSISNSSYLVGQSAGGVTARMVGGGQTLQGIMTVGTPNSGAPIKDDAADAAEYALYTLDDGYNVADTFIDFEDTEDDTALWDTIAGAISYGIGYIGAASDEIENYIGQFYPVFDEIGSSSTFMEYTLPGEGESSNVATRIESIAARIETS